jgi:hypothetical protein
MSSTIDYTVDQTSLSLVKSVQAHPLLPLSANTLTETQLIEFIDEDMRSTIVPLVLAAQEEWYVQNYDITPTAGVFTYTIPARAAFATWRDVCFVDTLGNEINMTELSPEYVKITYPVGNLPPMYTFGFILRNDVIQLWPPNMTVPTQFILRMKIKRRPNHLTSYNNCGQVQTINTGTGVIALSKNGDGTWTTATTFDVIPNSPQFTSRADDKAITGIDNTLNTITMATLPTGLVVGDWICPAGMSCVPQIPYDMFPLLIQRGVIRALESLGDNQNLQVAERRYQDMAVDFARTVSPRIQGARKALVNRTANFGWNYNRGISR